MNFHWCTSFWWVKQYFNPPAKCCIKCSKVQSLVEKWSFILQNLQFQHDVYHHIVVSYVNSSDKLLLDSACKWQNCKKSFSTKLYYCMWMKRVQFRQGSSHPQRSPPYHVPIWSAILKPTTAPWKGSLGCTVIYCNWNKWTAASFAHLHSVAIMYNNNVDYLEGNLLQTHAVHAEDGLCDIDRVGE